MTNKTMAWARELKILYVGIPWILSFVVSSKLQDYIQSPVWLKVAIALLPIPVFAVFLIFIILNVRQMDELNRQVHLEALVFAFPLSILMLMTMGLLQKVVPLAMERWNYVEMWGFMISFYYVGLAVAWTRYR